MTISSGDTPTGTMGDGTSGDTPTGTMGDGTPGDQPPMGDGTPTGTLGEIRSIAVPLTRYARGTREFVFETPAPGSWLMSVDVDRADWPGTEKDIAAVVSLIWDDGVGLRVVLPGGVVLDRHGNPLTTHTLRVTTQRIRDAQGRIIGHRQPLGAKIVLTTVQPIDAAIRAEVK